MSRRYFHSSLSRNRICKSHQPYHSLWINTFDCTECRMYLRTTHIHMSHSIHWRHHIHRHSDFHMIDTFLPTYTSRLHMQYRRRSQTDRSILYSGQNTGNSPLNYTGRRTSRLGSRKCKFPLENRTQQYRRVLLRHSVGCTGCTRRK